MFAHRLRHVQVGATLKVVNSIKSQPHLIFGMDANSHFNGKPGKTLAVDAFVETFHGMGLMSCFDGMYPVGTPLPHTTFNARTYLQPQLNKAIRLEDRETSPLTERNPKDFILFKEGTLVPVRVCVVCFYRREGTAGYMHNFDRSHIQNLRQERITCAHEPSCILRCTHIPHT